MMNQTVTQFLTRLKTKLPDEYSLVELQTFLQETTNHYRRFKGKEEKEQLNRVFNTMAREYNRKLKERYNGAVRDVYKIDYLLKEVNNGDRSFENENG